MKIMYERLGIFKERKNIHWVRKILFFIFFLLFLLVALKFGRVYLQNVIKNIELTNESVKAWISTSLSFWGSIIASLLSGTLTIIGVWWTIKYYRDSDAKKSRMECMPFLMLEAKCYTDKEVDRDSVDDGVHVYEIYSNMSKDASEEKILYYRTKIAEKNGVVKNDIKSDTMMKLRLIQISIIHHKGIALKYVKKCKK